MLFLGLTPLVFAADSKVEDLPENTTIAGTDVIYLVDDPGGTPAGNKITATNLFDIIDTYAELNSIVADQTITNNSLIDTFNELDAIVADEDLVNEVKTQTLTNKTIDGDDNTLQDIAVSQTKLVAGRSLTLSTDTLNADAELYTTMISIAMTNFDDTNDAEIQALAPQAFTITRVDCSTDTGTATIQLDERVLTTPNTGGTDIMTAVLVCDSDNQQTSAFDNASIAVDALISLDIDAVASDPTTLRINIKGTFDD